MSYVPQEKVLGSPIAFTNYREVDLKRFAFPDDIFGIYAYQQVAVKVDATTRDAFTNGNVNDLQNVIEANGMQMLYLRISWNEYPNYEIRDLAVGVVVKATSPLDVTADRLTKVLSYVGWYKNLISKLSMPWKAYLLLFPSVSQPAYSWSWEAKSGPYQLSSISGTPSPPSIDETRSHFINDGQVDNALGKFVRSMLDDGYQVTLLGYQARICYETIRTWQHGDRSYAEYKTHTQLQVNLTSTPTLDPFFTTAMVAAIGKAIALIIAAIIGTAAVFYALNNLTTTEKTWQHWEWVQNPETGEWEWRITDQGSEKAPPEWWGTVLTAIGIVSVVIVAAVVIPRVLPAPKQKT